MIRLSRRPASPSDAAFERRLSKWRKGEIELSDEEADRLLAECDPDIVLITKYLGAMLEPDEEAEVELRAETDEAFAKDLLLLAAGDARVHAGLHDESLFGLYAEENAKARRRGVVLLLAFILTAAYEVAFAASHRVREAQTWVSERAADRASTVNFFRPESIIAARGDTSLAFGGADVALRNGGRLTYGFQARNTGGSGAMALDGEAAFHAWSSAIVLRTSRWVVHMLAGRYAVSSIPFSGVTLVTVDSGSAWIERPGAENSGGSTHRVLATVQTGQRAIVGRDGEVSIVRDNGAFPKSAFRAPTGSHEKDATQSSLSDRLAYSFVEASIKNVHGIRR